MGRTSIDMLCQLASNNLCPSNKLDTPAFPCKARASEKVSSSLCRPLLSAMSHEADVSSPRWSFCDHPRLERHTVL